MEKRERGRGRLQGMPASRDAVKSETGIKMPPGCWEEERWDSSEHHGDGLGGHGFGWAFVAPNGCPWIRMGFQGSG